MSDIQTVAAEAAASGSLNSAESVLSTDGVIDSFDCNCHETVKMLAKKIDELVREVNTIKDALSGD
jgi:hypothetical protein